MNFVGVIGKNRIFKNIIYERLNVIKISNYNVDNIKNVKFDIIVINDNLSKFSGKSESLKKIIKNAEYIIVNSDLEIKSDVFTNVKKKIITYGLNQKATITISSRTRESILIDLQRDIETLDRKVVESGEHFITFKDEEDFNMNDVLINFAISIIYNKKIMDVI